MIRKNLYRLNSIRILNSLRYKNGLFGASRKGVDTGYNVAWIRDNIYEAMGLEKINIKRAVKTYQALFDILLKHEDKIDWAIEQKPDARFKYIHARFHPNTLNEFHEEWGNKQNDSIGAFLFRIGHLHENGIKVIRDINDLHILQKLVSYLESVEYWHDKDNGIWEENEEIHASSVGACVAGLKKVSNLVDVPHLLIQKGQETLNWLLPRESTTKKVDLALLSLIYPYNIVSNEQKALILENVEKHLVKEKGVLRYTGDYYYNDGKEAEWCMGFPWLAKIYKDIGNKNKHNHYMKKTYQVMNFKGEIPELYHGVSRKANDNTPLGWAQALYLIAIS